MGNDPYIKVSELMEVVAKRLHETDVSERGWLAERLIFEIMNWGGFNYYESIGIAECAIDTYKQVAGDILDEDQGDENADNKT